MATGRSGKNQVTSGVAELDRFLGNLFIGDNVIWYDQAGSLASFFCLKFLESSLARKKPVVYVSFDRSPRNLLDQLGNLAESPYLTILDCFTWGKGAGSEVFLSFYYEERPESPCRIVRVDEPRVNNQVMDTLYGIHSSLHGDVRFIFESLTGIQELWGGEDNVINFYTHSCPRLYELNTVAYWVVEKEAHTPRLRAQINQIAQVVIDLSIKRGKTSLTILKAEKRDSDNFHKPFNYWTKDLTVSFEEEKGGSARMELGRRLREFRTRRGVSQTDLARLVGVTPSTISQIESNLIYPSLPALLKIAEVLSVRISSFFHDKEGDKNHIVFPSSAAAETKLPAVTEGGLTAKSLCNMDFGAAAEPYLLEFAPGRKIGSHFFAHKGEEMGYLISGKLNVTIEDVSYKLRAGDTIYLTTEIPEQWENPGPSLAKLLWVKLR
ncbi:MAG: helix-turn-helix domain-containing protein [Pseudomonadota bacterium]